MAERLEEFRMNSGIAYRVAGLHFALAVLAVVCALTLSGCSGGGYSNQQTQDTIPPTAPAGLTATAASATQINLAWTASTDNVAVTGYKVERCAGAGCSTFAQVATPSGTTFNDTGLTASTAYSYRVRANDAAGNNSSYSNTASATTQAATGVSVTISPVRGSVTISQTQQFTATVTGSANTAVTWQVDGTPGGSAALGTISAAGLYTPPSTGGTHTITAQS